MNESKRILIFDCDPGIDDAIALGFLAGVLKSAAELRYDDVFLLATWGNTDLEHTYRNVIICSCVFNLPAKIVKGRMSSVKGSVVRAEKVHGKDGLGGYSKKYFELFVKGREDKRESFSLRDLLVYLENAHDAKIEIITTGPLSSSYEIIKNSNIREKVVKFVWMGGAFFEDGNITPYAEFNSYCDPEGVEALLDFAREKKCVHVVPLDSTKKTQIAREEFLKRIADLKNATVKEFIKDITEKAEILILHDTLAVFSFFYPESVKTFISHAEVDKEAFRGKIYSIISPNLFLKVVYDFDLEGLFENLIKSLSVAE